MSGNRECILGYLALYALVYVLLYVEYFKKSFYICNHLNSKSAVFNILVIQACMKNQTQLIILITLLSTITGIIYYYKDPVECKFEPMIERLRNDMVKLEPMAENLQFYSSDESYTEDKQRIFLCLKDSDGNYYPYNQLLEVAIHELAHAMCTVVDVNHNSQEWNDLFKELLQKAVTIGMYNPAEPKVPNYCVKN